MALFWWGLGVAWAGAPDLRHAGLALALEGKVDPLGRVDYAALAAQRATLDQYLVDLRDDDLAGLSKADQLAWWINAYNAATLQLVVDNRPLKSLRDLDGGEVWKRRSFLLAGEALTLDAIEHQRVRPLGDGRVHAALNCASRGCPPLPAEPLRGEALESQLDAAAARWVAHNAAAVSGGQLGVSAIFEWFASDFDRWRALAPPGAPPALAGGLGFLWRYSAADQREAWTAAVGRASVSPYDWALNAIPGRE
jgi:hypothetical protein